MHQLMKRSAYVVALLCLSTLSASAAEREIQLTGKYLLVPISNDARTRPGRLMVTVDGETAHVCPARIAVKTDQIAWWAYLDVGEYVGKTAKLEAASPQLITSADQIKSLMPLYREKGRPQIHFSQRRGWNNDTNGMVYYDGEYHLMWQANPTSKRMGNQHWGHAVSKDLVHWEELPIALRPNGKGIVKRHRSMADGACYSGGAFVDHNNTLGKQTLRPGSGQAADVKTLVAAFTDTALGESLAFSTDKGRTFTLLREHNPIYRHQHIGRDPKIIWHEATKQWVMVVFSIKKSGPKDRGMQFLVSKDLVKWEETCFVKGFNECPEFFELPVLDAEGKKPDSSEDYAGPSKKWILMGADANYMVGSFDGRVFKNDGGKLDTIHGCYAGQCFSSAPNGRAVYMGWVRTLKFPKELPIASGFTLPIELTLRKTTRGLRLFANPVKELDNLREKVVCSVESKTLSGAENKVSLSPKEKLVEFNVILKADGKAEEVTFSFDGVPLKYNFKRGGFIPAKGKPSGRSGFSHDGGPRTFDLRVYIDEASIEIFAEGGSAYFIVPRRADRVGEPVEEISLTVNGGNATVERMTVHKLKSIWKK